MPSAKGVVAVAIAIAIAAIFILPVADVVNSHTGTQSVDNESVTADLDTWVDLQQVNLVEDSETVLWLNATSDSWEELADADYDIRYGQGQLNVSSGGDVSNGDDLRVSYDYEATGDTTATVIGFLPLLLAVMIIAVVGDYISKEVG